MQPKQVKNDILAILQTEKYFADSEFYRLLDDNSIPHSIRVSLMKKQLIKINEIVQCAKILDVMLPEKQEAEAAENPNE